MSPASGSLPLKSSRVQNERIASLLLRLDSTRSFASKSPGTVSNFSSATSNINTNSNTSSSSNNTNTGDGVAKEKDKEALLVKKPETKVEKVIREVKEEKAKEVSDLNNASANTSMTSNAAASRNTNVSSTTQNTSPPISISAQTTSSQPAPTATATTTGVPQSSFASIPAIPASTAVAPPLEPKKSLIHRIKDEAHHVWMGMKLLGAETRISTRLLFKLLAGNSLTRREDLQLKRTIADLIRLVPMVIILIIPFLELALPFLLYLFPNMLPSTFESKFQAEEKKKKLLKVRLEMARFLQETVAEVAVTGSSRATKAKEFTDFFTTYRNSGVLAPTSEILTIAKKFQDELTLNSLSRPQLVSMARYMNLNAFGTDSYLRNQINDQLVSLKMDDAVISREGINSLTIPELQAACQQRGIKTIGASPARLKSELTQWLDLHLKHGVPGSLLILSRAFTISEKIPVSSHEALKGSAEALQATLSSLPQQVVNEAQLHVAQVAGTATSNQKLNVIKEQEELIEDELEQDEIIKAAAQKDKQVKVAAATAAATAAAATSASASVSTASPSQDAAKSDAPSIATDIDLSHDELKKVGEAIKVMVSGSALDDVKAKLVDLKEEQKEQNEDITELKNLTQKESKAATTVSSHVEKMISKIEAEINKIDSEIGSKMNVIQPDARGKMTVEEIQNALSMVKDNPGDERIKKIVQRLDSDGDGEVSTEEVMAFVNETAASAAAATAASGSGAVLPSSAPSVPSSSVTGTPSDSSATSSAPKL
ncbi:hypothetical protein HK100_006508 [Physocladia obscura]|uniref:Mitochondrial proton/calcium exchanger protein n=1 Tax=Physocladia obscura TaxID=109957 RepID=A0AAD5SRD7_9FUNG|nr:hypothetical protein HK100_006508 [Physocladia obscura]